MKTFCWMMESSAPAPTLLVTTPSCAWEPGAHIVVQVLPEGWLQTHPPLDAHSITVEGDQTATNISFGAFKVLDFGGDATGDGRIDLADNTYISEQWGTDDPAADINGDRTVDLLDLVPLGKNFDKTGCP